MLRKTMLLAGAVAAVAALAIPPTAGASPRNWMHSGGKLNYTREIFPFGILGFSSDQGGYACPIKATIDLEPGSTGTVTAISVTDTKQCTYSGTLDVLCDEVDAHASTGLPWTIHATKYSNGSYGIAITSLDLDIGGTGMFCPDVTWSGTLTTTTNPHQGWLLHLEGTLSSNITSVVSPFSTWELTPTKTYKIET